MRRGSQRIGESELSGSLHSQGNYHFRQRRRMESGGAVYQLSQRKLQEVVASLDAGGTTLASGGGHSSTSLPSSSWLGASKPIQEGPESGVDDGAQIYVGESGAEDYNNVDLRDLLHAVYGEVYHKGAAESCGARSAGIVQGAPRAPDFTGQDLLPCGWELMQAFGGQCPCGRVLNAATKCGRKLLGSKW